MGFINFRRVHLYCRVVITTVIPVVPFGTLGALCTESRAVPVGMKGLTPRAFFQILLFEMRRKGLISGLLIRECTRTRILRSTGKLSIESLIFFWVGAIYDVKNVRKTIN